jgi:hypothetical protein
LILSRHIAVALLGAPSAAPTPTPATHPFGVFVSRSRRYLCVPFLSCFGQAYPLEVFYFGVSRFRASLARNQYQFMVLFELMQYCRYFFAFMGSS